MRFKSENGISRCSAVPIDPGDDRADRAVRDPRRATWSSTTWPTAWRRPASPTRSTTRAGTTACPIGYLRELVEYWRDGYDWRAHEARLNELAHFRTRIDGQEIHFVHAALAAPDALPLLLIHGWPGSVVEFLDVIPRLTDPESHGGRAGDAFHVIAPSLPGYGFSEPTRTRGWDPQRIAHAFIELMDRLGYARYAAQGGDWGAQVATRIGALDPEHCAAIHLNMPIAGPPTDPVALTDEEQADLAAFRQFQREESGVRARAGHETADARRGAQRLARRPARLDRREVPRVERLRRRPRERLHPRPAAHERDALLGHADDHVLGAAVPRGPAGRPARRGAAVRRGSHRRRALSQGGAALPAARGSSGVTT